jgi:Fe-S cluster biogenesis protein NfuA
MSTGPNIVSIYTEMTPNPETMKFVANKLLYPGKSIDIADESTAHVSPLAQALFAFPFVKGVFIASNFVTLTKTADTAWEDVVPNLRDFFKQYLESGQMVIDEAAVSQLKQLEPSDLVIPGEDGDVVHRIKELLENYVKPAVEMDGGAISFRGYQDGVVTLALQGSCSGCPSSMVTLKAGIEGMMKRMIPEVREVVAENDLV